MCTSISKLPCVPDKHMFRPNLRIPEMFADIGMNINIYYMKKNGCKHILKEAAIEINSIL